MADLRAEEQFFWRLVIAIHPLHHQLEAILSPRAILQGVIGIDYVYARIVVAVAFVVDAIFSVVVVVVVVVVAVVVVVLNVSGYAAVDVDLELALIPFLFSHLLLRLRLRSILGWPLRYYRSCDCSCPCLCHCAWSCPCSCL